jgi:hypothetical protein
MTSLIPQLNDLQILQTIAKTAHTSGLYNGVGGCEKILMVLLAAQDLGIKPTIALNGGIWNIQGKIEISARLMTSMIRKAGHNISIKECNDKICTLKGKRADNGDEVETTFSWDDAVKAGLAGRDVWKKYAEDMLYARAMSRLARRLFPDVIGTAYVEGEIRDGSMIDVTPDKESMRSCKHMTKEQKEIESSAVISDDQLNELNECSQSCDPEYMAKVHGYLESIGIAGFAFVKEALFNRILLGMKKNAEVYKPQAVLGQEGA